MDRWKKLLVLITLLIVQEHAYGMYNNDLGKGGPPKQRPVFGSSMRIYDRNESIHEDETGRAYIEQLSHDQLMEKMNSSIKAKSYGDAKDFARRAFATRGRVNKVWIEKDKLIVDYKPYNTEEERREIPLHQY